MDVCNGKWLVLVTVAIIMYCYSSLNAANPDSSDLSQAPQRGGLGLDVSDGQRIKVPEALRREENKPKVFPPHTYTDETGSRLTIVARHTELPVGAPVQLEVLFKGNMMESSGIVIDFDGDGMMDAHTFDPFAFYQHTFDAPGFYTITARLQEKDTLHVARLAVTVTDTKELETRLKALWENFNNALLTGDLDTARKLMTRSAWRKYGPLYENILPQIQAGILRASAVHVKEILADSADLLVIRDVDGKQHGYLVRMQKAHDGEWRIHSM